MSPIAVQDLLNAYVNGWFPMADDKEGGDIHWYEPHLRGIIPMEAFKVSKNVRRLIKKNLFKAKINNAFEEVIRSCADRESSWISEDIIHSYIGLHNAGFADSVELYTSENELIGGLYGVRLGNAFFGESMFKKRPEADKIALYFCHKYLLKIGIELWDTQFYTDHLGQFGAVEITKNEYKQKLAHALRAILK
jgi:leucyl/phenylalanyl-tRNA--protein transferase